MVAVSEDAQRVQVRWARNTYWHKANTIKPAPFNVPVDPNLIELTEDEITILSAARSNLSGDITEDGKPWVHEVVEESGLSQAKAWDAILSLSQKDVIRVQTQAGSDDKIMRLTTLGYKVFNSRMLIL